MLSPPLLFAESAASLFSSSKARQTVKFRQHRKYRPRKKNIARQSNFQGGVIVLFTTVNCYDVYGILHTGSAGSIDKFKINFGIIEKWTNLDKKIEESTTKGSSFTYIQYTHTTFRPFSVLARQPSRAADFLLRSARGGGMGTPPVYWHTGGGDLHI